MDQLDDVRDITPGINDVGREGKKRDMREDRGETEHTGARAAPRSHARLKRRFRLHTDRLQDRITWRCYLAKFLEPLFRNIILINVSECPMNIYRTLNARNIEFKVFSIYSI